MGLASTSAVIAQTSNATFQAWVNETYTNLVTNCGLTQMSALMDTGQMAVPCVSAVPGGANAQAGYYNFLFSDPLAKGAVALSVLLALTPGTGYNGGTAHTFTGVTMSGGTGTGCIATVVLGASGVVSSITPTSAGTGYQVGDQLTVTSANIVAAGGAAGGGSSGFGFVGALTSGTPVVMKMEFGSGSLASDPMVLITVSSGWASNGTLVGSAGTTSGTRRSVFAGSAPVSTITAYTSRYNWNPTLGYLGFVFKIGGLTATGALGALFIYRSNDTGGNPTGTAVVVAANGIGTVGATSAAQVGAMECFQYANGAITSINTLSATNSCQWIATQNTSAAMMLGITASITLGAGQAVAVPTYYLGPLPTFSAYAAAAFVSEAPVNVTVPIAIIGTTQLTFLSVGQPFGSGGIGGLASNILSYLMLWQ